MKKNARSLAAMMIAGGIACAAPASAADDVVIVYDASGSMWGQIDGVSKIEIARDVLAGLVDEWDAGTNLGLVAYGHRSQGDCTDIETLISPAPLDRASFIDTVNGIRPVGKTPISASVQHAADLLSYRDNSATVILISDGVETCNADPCALAAQLAKQGVKFTAHVVGFDLEDAAHASLSCIAENTGGVFVPAGNAAELHDALDQVQSAMELKPVMPEPEPELPEVGISGPASVTTGAAFDVTWSGSVHPQDFITIVPMGAKEGESGAYIRVRDMTEGTLIAPAEIGLYELRYVLNEGRRTLATATIEVIEAEVGIAGPANVTTGAAFDVTWSGSVHPQDFITIVPMGAKEGESGAYIRVRDMTEGVLTAPAEIGLYELRYVLNEGRRTLATAAIEVVEAEVGIAGPHNVMTGAAFDVTWSGSVHPQDFITIVPMGTKEGESGAYIRVRDMTEGTLTAPAEIGLYELRYVLNEGRRTLATAAIEVVSASITLSGPTTVREGTPVAIGWSQSVNVNDFITIVTAGAAEGSAGDYIRVRSATEGELAAPDGPGLYEIRYVLEEGKKTLASATLEVVHADAPLDDGAGLSVPKSAAPGETITVTWTGESDSADQRIALARSEQPDFSWISVQSVTAEKSMELTMPDEAGLYEVRFLDVAGRQVLGRAIVDVK
ncbi:VWA domain-containing protein [Oceaniovalibus sp. ACAM 378]|uniref:VWA domain-containing protein n=1 Tax=Oceaniovalibus sp. ACAM 378 TaxID=2599923 RepID=UPI0011D96DCF|nr:VWA domain-containing protein [Oceaniovalibus sp. ACAM 378]TYB88404.1 VWA domain-containing protein [Oceaniovalibus sp. ACAM 378]